MNQNSINDKISRMATSYAINGTPVETIQWIPPQSASSNPDGTFVVKFSEPQSGSNTPPWLR